MQNIQIKIPIESYMKKYLERNRYLQNGKVISHDDYIGKYIMLLLNTKRKQGRPLKITQNDYIILDISYLHRGTQLISISQENVQEFHKFLKQHMLDDYMKYALIMCTETKVCGQHEAIHRWRAKYDLTNQELTFDALKKHYQRKKEIYINPKYLGIKKNRSKTSLLLNQNKNGRY
jgi:hypothetical protein